MVFKIRSLILYIFLLKLRVLFDFALSYINKCSRVAKMLLKKNLKLNLGQRFYLTLIFVLVLVEADLTIKIKGANNI